MLGFAPLGVLPLGALSASVAVASPGPADDRGRRRIEQGILAAALRHRARDEEERKRFEAIAEAEEALDRAETAKLAETRRQAVRDVFRALGRSHEAQAIARATAEQVRAAMARLDAEIEAMRAEMLRREEEEFVLLQLWAN